MPCNIFSQRYALQNTRNALGTLVYTRGVLQTELTKRGLSREAILSNPGLVSLDESIRKVAATREWLESQLGMKTPKSMTLLKLLLGLSPGTVQLWLDSDTGWFTEARVTPGSPPVYHHVTDDTAMTILKGELTHELEAELMKPDEYIGE